MLFRPALFTLVSALVLGFSSLVLAVDGGGNPPDGGIVGDLDSGLIDSSASSDVAVVPDVAAATPDLAVAAPDVPATADTRVELDSSVASDAPWTSDGVASADAPVALDTSGVADVRVAVDAFVAIDLATEVDSGAKASDGGAGDGGSGPPPVYLPDGGAKGLIADDTGCSFGGGRPAKGTVLIPLFGLVALWIARRRGRR
jgi:hypothetical protein